MNDCDGLRSENTVDRPHWPAVLSTRLSLRPQDGPSASGRPLPAPSGLMPTPPLTGRSPRSRTAPLPCRSPVPPAARGLPWRFDAWSVKRGRAASARPGHPHIPSTGSERQFPREKPQHQELGNHGHGQASPEHPLCSLRRGSPRVFARSGTGGLAGGGCWRGVRPEEGTELCLPVSGFAGCFDFFPDVHEPCCGYPHVA